MPQVMPDKALNAGLPQRPLEAPADVHQAMPRLAGKHIVRAQRASGAAAALSRERVGSSESPGARRSWCAARERRPA